MGGNKISYSPISYLKMIKISVHWALPLDWEIFLTLIINNSEFASSMKTEITREIIFLCTFKHFNIFLFQLASCYSLEFER